ncbi:hypothetical protein GW860_04375 [bacterium]|nr:hypothetical protein [bacterium]
MKIAISGRTLTITLITKKHSIWYLHAGIGAATVKGKTGRQQKADTDSGKWIRSVAWGSFMSL